ncbi:response regulator [Taibaiella chishuiensis]|uniref:LuxR family two component transcriptional regulator n=1 Tax=Taibaiella chishuiensis TaxID=1434707 RepID=A0A2P8D304_9BACT|nr:response regulator transcription factor [Taibaiella chishuiensis]PSK91593.1 LuxR family two component transcriptional regulator [Taibaiella chishuiensis]
MNKKRIIIFDDDTTRRDSLSMLLNMCPDMECVGAFASAADAVTHVAQTEPDMVLMDIDMPRGNGIDGTSRIKSAYPLLPVIMQTVFDDNQNIFEAIKAGANGYLLKKTPPDKLLEQLREAFDGGAPMTGTVAIKVLQFFREEPVSPSYKLSEREKDILKLLVEGHSYKMIAAKSNIAYYTVCNHIKKIYEKLHVNSATEAVKIAILQRLV